MVPGNFKLSAADPKFPIVLNGKYKQIRFWLDNSLKDDTLGITAAPRQSLRVVVLDINGKVIQKADFLVGRGDKDTGTPPAWLTFTDPAHSESLGISQGSQGPCDQRIGFGLVNV